MPRARKHLVCLEDTPYYHVMSRCVRRAFLCGEDRESGKSYEHRRDWIEARMRLLSSLFSIEVCAYAIMSNHYHLVVKLAPVETTTWSDDEVLERWTALFKGPLLVQRYRNGEPLDEAEADTLASTTAVYRQRLSSLSWFMKCLNEPIARQANAEDRCTGHFWEARFRSQALLSERALVTAMAYVDLNPIRAGIAATPEASDYTSVKARIQPDETAEQLCEAIQNLLRSGDARHAPVAVRPLMAFQDQLSGDAHAESALPIRWPDYLALVDTTGRVAVLGKRGRIDPELTPVLERIGMTNTQWLSAACRFQEHYQRGELLLSKAS